MKRFKPAMIKVAALVGFSNFNHNKPLKKYYLILDNFFAQNFNEAYENFNRKIPAKRRQF